MHCLSGQFTFTVKVSNFVCADFIACNRKLSTISACKINYYHNFWIKDDTRLYYAGEEIPDIIQVEDYQFVKHKVIKVWITSMVLSWMSATNCMCPYNAALAEKASEPPAGWRFGFTVTSDHVYNGFMIYCLLEDLISQTQTLSVPHKTCQDKDRYLDVICAWNQCMWLYSQPVVQHYCNKCTRFSYDGKFFLFFTFATSQHFYGPFTRKGICDCHRWCYDWASMLWNSQLPYSPFKQLQPLL